MIPVCPFSFPACAFCHGGGQKLDVHSATVNSTKERGSGVGEIVGVGRKVALGVAATKVGLGGLV